MADCLILHSSQGAQGADGRELYWYKSSPLAVSDCNIEGDSSQFISIPTYEYQNLLVASGGDISISTALTFVTPEEISAVFGTCFALVFFLGAVGYKIKVAKRVIKQS